MNGSADDNGWPSYGFTFTLGQTHDLPAEPPNYDEFEFSFPEDVGSMSFGDPGMSSLDMQFGMNSFGGGGGGLGTGGFFSSAYGSPPSLFDQPSPSVHTTSLQNIASPDTSTTAAGQSTVTSPTQPTISSLSPEQRLLPDQQQLLRCSQPATESPTDFKAVQPELFRSSEKTALDNFFAKVSQPSPPRTDEAGRQGSTDAGPSRPTPRTQRTSASHSQRPAEVKLDDDDEDEELDHSAEDQDEEDMQESEDIKPTRSPVKANGTKVKRPRIDATGTRKTATAALGKIAKRSNHIASEHRRRTTIKDNYKALVDLLIAGEAESGISLSASNDSEASFATDGKIPKAKGRGRGRKGQVGAGATKSAVLERAADYIRWLERGNAALEAEVSRVGEME